jgi:hypothetical protein
VLAFVPTAGCARDLVREDGGWRDPRRGWSIAEPAGDWSPARVEGASLALRGPRGEWMTVSVRCGVPLAAPALMARHLLLGLGAAAVREERAVEVDGRPAWLQVFEARAPEAGAAAASVRIRAVTRVDERCVQDFVLAGPGEEAVFDAWWASFRAGAGP